MRAQVLAAVCAAMLGMTAAVAAGQTGADAEQGAVEQPAIPTTPVPSGQTPPTEGSAETTPPDATDPATGDGEGQEPSVDWSDRGVGSALAQSSRAKRAEVRLACEQTNEPPPSPMLGIAGTTGGDPQGPWVLLAALIAAGAAAVALVAWLRRRRASAGAAKQPRSSLETVATIVAILGTTAGLLVQFVPGVGARDEAGPSVEMEVRDVDARIRQDEYFRKMGFSRGQLEKADRAALGNVVWLEVRLSGYEGERPRIQYAAHDPDHGNVLLPETARSLPLKTIEHREEQRFVPVWMGYPKTDRYEAHFRLLHEREVRQIASTGAMRAAKYRFDCDTEAR